MRQPASDFDFLGLHLKPLPAAASADRDRGALAGLARPSKLAGERGFLPLSISLNRRAHRVALGLGEAWRRASGRTPERRDWRLVREVYVAPTDEQARKRVREGALGRCWRDYLLPFYVGSGMGAALQARAAQPDSVLDVDYLIENNWLVGSPATVAEKLARLRDVTGGFGTLLVMLYDFSDEAEEWDESLALLVDEVLPRVASL